jgi:hypothetical protein
MDAAAAATVTGGKGVVMTYQMALGMLMQNKHKALLVAGLVAVVKKAVSLWGLGCRLAHAHSSSEQQIRTTAAEKFNGSNVVLIPSMKCLSSLIVMRI